MVKTRHQALNATIKKEEREDKPKLERLLRSTNNMSKTKGEITKNRKPIQAQMIKVKPESINDNKALLALPKKAVMTPKTTKEQVAKLIGYLVNDKMSVRVAAKKAGMADATASKYYQTYKDDPEHRIPAPPTRTNKQASKLSQQKIDNVIRYIVDDGMSLPQASKKAVIHKDTARKYYAIYMKDPERKIPLLNMPACNTPKSYTQEDIANFIFYIVRDKMSLLEARKKINMSERTAKRYYLKYLHDPNHKVPDPCEPSHLSGKHCTNDQVKSLIGYIVNDEMTLLEASVKAKIGRRSASKYYKQYLDDPENNIPTPETNNIYKPRNRPTLDQVKNFFHFIIIDKLNVHQAARKTNISRNSAYAYYNQYLKNPSQEIKMNDMSYSAEKMKRLVELVQNEKMDLKDAADTVHLNHKSARIHYKEYLSNPHYEFPTNKSKQYTQEDIKELIDLVECHKIGVSVAAKRIKMSGTVAQRYYAAYQNDPEHKIPTPNIKGNTRKYRTINKYSQIVSDIYKNNPSIKRIHESDPSELDERHANIKQESAEEDKNIIIKTESS